MASTSAFSSQTSSPRLRAQSTSKRAEAEETESGYASASSARGSGSDSDSDSSDSDAAPGLPQITLTKPHLRYLNQQMEKMTAMDRLRFALHLFPRLFQTTAFGLTGLVTMDMLARLSASDPSLPAVEAIFLDTLHHFPETYALLSRVRARYPSIKLHVYRPDGAATPAEFEARYGPALYDSAAELYDWVAKVEPQQRAYAELGVAAVLTGRRRSQGGERDRLPVLEVDEERGIVKVNPLLDWSFAQVRAYIAEHDVPYNELLDRGYKSVGDWHSTSPVGAGEDERAGRWKGQQKTECGIHNKKSRYAQFLAQQEQIKQQQQQQEKHKEKENEGHLISVSS
ncbi:phosphoadenosine phosphosulfate reductase [Nemania serpens]|nr:phosphoadenosine phosphosulfate reductase [Nemania serpens]